jgi:hypothetical protein
MEGMMRYCRSLLASYRILIYGLLTHDVSFFSQVLTGPTVAERGIEGLSQIPLHGFVNDIAVGPKARFCAVAVGQEPRLGRWDRVARAKNRFCIVQLRRDGNDEDDEEDAPEVGSNALVGVEVDSSLGSSEEDSD